MSQVGRFQRDDLDFTYRIDGNGPWLLLVNGIAADHAAWDPNIEHLRRHFRCLRLDNRGVGASSALAGAYSTRAMADDAAALLDALDIPKAHVLGASMGGAIAQELALRRADRVGRVVVACGFAVCDGSVRRCFELIRDIARASHAAGRPWFVDLRRFLSLIAFAPASFRNRADLIAAADRDAARQARRPFTASSARRKPASVTTRSAVCRGSERRLWSSPGRTTFLRRCPTRAPSRRRCLPPASPSWKGAAT